MGGNQVALGEARLVLDTPEDRHGFLKPIGRQQDFDGLRIER